MSREYPAVLLRKIDEIVGRYPKKAAALIPVLRLIQDEAGCVSADRMAFSPNRTASLTTFLDRSRSPRFGDKYRQRDWGTNLALSSAGSSQR